MYPSSIFDYVDACKSWSRSLVTHNIHDRHARLNLAFGSSAFIVTINHSASSLLFSSPCLG